MLRVAELMMFSCRSRQSVAVLLWLAVSTKMCDRYAGLVDMALLWR